MEAALKIIESQILLMGGREQFNDPFDCNVPYIHSEQFDEVFEKIKQTLLTSSRNLPHRYSGLPRFKAVERNWSLNACDGSIVTTSQVEQDIRLWIQRQISLVASELPELSNPISSKARLVSFGGSATNLALWGYYGRSHTGVAIEFKFAEKHWHEDIFKVDYQQKEPNWLNATEWCDILFGRSKVFDILNEAGIQKRSFLIKSADWQHEDEYRFVRFDQDGSEPRPKLRLEVGEIARVIVGMSADPILASILKKVCESHNIPVSSTKRVASKFAIEIEED